MPKGIFDTTKPNAKGIEIHFFFTFFALLRGYQNRPLYYVRPFPKEIAFGQIKCCWNMALDNTRPYKDVSLFLDEIK